MCRYAFKKYKAHFACFQCRKVFKKTPIEDYLAQHGKEFAYWQFIKFAWNKNKCKEIEVEFRTTLDEIRNEYLEKISICPDCGGKMAHMGLDFRAPKKSDIQAWEAAKGLYEIGMSFISCGCDGPGYIPTDRSEYRKHLRNISFQYKETLKRWEQDTDSETEKKIEARAYWTNRIESVEIELSKIK